MVSVYYYIGDRTFMPLAIRVDLTGVLTDDNILYSLLILNRLLSLRIPVNKEVESIRYRVDHVGSSLFLEIWIKETPASRVFSPSRS